MLDSSLITLLLSKALLHSILGTPGVSSDTSTEHINVRISPAVLFPSVRTDAVRTDKQAKTYNK